MGQSLTSLMPRWRPRQRVLARYHGLMDSDDEVCLCFSVTKRKIVNYCKREKPPVASLISECLSAGTGCGWCVPFLTRLHEQALAGDPEPDLPFSPADYARRRLKFRQSGERES
jgi:bacterioferritin-associated ferredoxin